MSQTLRPISGDASLDSDPYEESARASPNGVAPESETRIARA
jgi:hypothetical protein